MKRMLMAATAVPTIALVGGVQTVGAQEAPRSDTVQGTNTGATATTVPAPSAKATTQVAAAAAVQDCGSAYDNWKYSTSVGPFTVDVFRHTIRTYLCEDNVNITRVESQQNDCQKYAWGVAYALSPGFSKGGVGTKSAWGTSTCRVQIGGTLGGVGLQYSKQSNQKHTFNMQSNGSATVVKDHWTTQP